MSNSSPPGRVDWADYAKGFCIIMVVMMHSTLGVEEAAGREGFMHALVAFAKPFRMPDFFLISGPVPVARDRPRLAHLPRSQSRAFRLFLCAVGDDPVRRQGAAFRRRRMAGPMSPSNMRSPSSIRSARCGSSTCCRSSSWSPRRRARLPPVLVWLVAAALQIAQIDTGWTAIDEFAGRFVYFYTGYIMAPRVFALAAAVQARPAAGAARPCAVGRRSMAALVYAGFRRAAGESRSRSASSAPAPWSRVSALMAKAKLVRPGALLRRSIRSSSISRSSCRWR